MIDWREWEPFNPKEMKYPAGEPEIISRGKHLSKRPRLSVSCMNFVSARH